MRLTSRRPKRIIDNELWQNAYLCESTRLRICFDKAKYFVGSRIIHPNGSVGSSQETHDGMVVEISDPLLRANGVMFWWAPNVNSD